MGRCGQRGAGRRHGDDVAGRRPERHRDGSGGDRDRVELREPGCRRFEDGRTGGDRRIVDRQGEGFGSRSDGTPANSKGVDEDRAHWEQRSDDRGLGRIDRKLGTGPERASWNLEDQGGAIVGGLQRTTGGAEASAHYDCTECSARGGPRKCPRRICGRDGTGRGQGHEDSERDRERPSQRACLLAVVRSDGRRPVVATGNKHAKARPRRAADPAAIGRPLRVGALPTRTSADDRFYWIRMHRSPRRYLRPPAVVSGLSRKVVRIVVSVPRRLSLRPSGAHVEDKPRNNIDHGPSCGPGHGT